jgi:heptosyltransferase-2
VKILVIRFSSIGDIVLTTPVIRCLSNQLENAEIHILVKPSFTPVIQNNPHISKIWFWENGVLTKLRKEGFDYIVDLHNNLRSFRVKMALKTPGSSFYKLNVGKYLLVRFRINRLPKIHVVDRYFDAVKDLGVKNDGGGIDFYPTRADEAITDLLPFYFLQNYTAVVCGALQGTKSIPESKLRDFCAGIQGNLLFIGGTKERELGESLQGFFAERSMSMCGKTTIGESAVLLKNARAVLTPDTGMMHIASAFNKPIAVIWGNTVPEFGMGPYLPKSDAAFFNSEVGDLHCRPCSKIGFSHCPKKHFNCMNLQNTERVGRWINQVNASR